MIETGKHLLGRPVFAPDAEEPLGRVSDILLRAGTGEVAALLLQTNSIIPFTRAVLWEDVRQVERRRIVVRAGSVLRPLAPEKEGRRMTAYFEQLHGRHMASSGAPGTKRIRDAVFDLEAGAMTELVLADDRFGKLFGKRVKMAAQSDVPPGIAASRPQRKDKEENENE